MRVNVRRKTRLVRRDCVDLVKSLAVHGKSIYAIWGLDFSVINKIENHYARDDTVHSCRCPPIAINWKPKTSDPSYHHQPIQLGHQSSCVERCTKRQKFLPDKVFSKFWRSLATNTSFTLKLPFMDWDLTTMPRKH